MRDAVTSAHMDMPFIKPSIRQYEEYAIFSMQKQIDAKNLLRKNSFCEEYSTHGFRWAAFTSIQE